MRGWLRALITLVGCSALLLASPVPAAAEGPAAITISPTSGPPGTAITVRGTNWTHETYASGVPVNIYQNYGNGNLRRLSEGHSGRPDAGGNFTIHMTVPNAAEPGLVTIGALTGGGSSTDAQFTVAGGTAKDLPTTLVADRAFTTNGTTAEQTKSSPAILSGTSSR